jgi:predicted amidohydrolase YtcJ
MTLIRRELGIVAVVTLLAACRADEPSAVAEDASRTVEQALNSGCPTRTILHHGHVFTADPGHAWAEAIAVEGDRIVAVGSNASVLAHQTPGTKLVDLGGRTVIPGLNDSHVHVAVPEGQALNTLAFIPGPGPTLAEVKGLISSSAAAVPAGTWLLGFVGTPCERSVSRSKSPIRSAVTTGAWRGRPC